MYKRKQSSFIFTIVFIVLFIFGNFFISTGKSIAAKEDDSQTEFDSYYDIYVSKKCYDKYLKTIKKDVGNNNGKILDEYSYKKDLKDDPEIKKNIKS